MKKLLKQRGKRKMWWIIPVTIIGVLAILIAVGIAATAPGRKEGLNLNIGVIDFKKLMDGVYVGEYKGTLDSSRNAKVEVTILNGEINAIKVIEGPLANEKQNAQLTKGQSLNDLFAKVVEEKSLQVDVISGATLSCKVHLKALEYALTQAQEK